MLDVQNSPAQIPLRINKVGVKDLKIPLTVLAKDKGVQHTTAKVDISVDLPKEFKGTHMSRFLEVLSSWQGNLSYSSLRTLLWELKEKLKARDAQVKFTFPYFLPQKAPKSGQSFWLDFLAEVEGSLIDDRLIFTLGVDVPVFTVCPCSLAISEKGAHSQRAVIRIKVGIKEFLWLEDLIEIARSAGSAPVYPLLKRDDEKAVTEEAFLNPMFVEDVVRKVALKLDNLDKILWYKVEVESFESIHNHSAYAIIGPKNKEF